MSYNLKKFSFLGRWLWIIGMLCVFSGANVRGDETYKVENCTSKNLVGEASRELVAITKANQKGADQCCDKGDLATNIYFVKKTTKPICMTTKDEWKKFRCVVKKITFHWVYCKY